MLSGSEHFFFNKSEPEFCVRDFWSWASSDLMSNRLRGILAEYLVARALQAIDEPRKEWDEVDIRTKDGFAIEVKSSAFVQTWEQTKPSIIEFNIAPSTGWNAITNEYDPEIRRRADAYVFCVLGAEDDPSPNPLDLTQWRFYVLPTSRLDEYGPRQKTIRLGPLISLEPAESSYENLSETIHACVRERM